MRCASFLLVIAATIVAATCFPPSETKMRALREGVRTVVYASISAEAAPAPPNDTSAATLAEAAPTGTGPSAPPSTPPAASPAAPPSAPAGAGAPHTPVVASLWYWSNNAQTNQDESICLVNSQPSITFYVKYYVCASNGCLDSPVFWSSNPYQWTIAIYRNGVLIAQLPPWNTSTAWIDQPITISTPLQPGTYYAVLNLKIQTGLFGSYSQYVNQTTDNNITFAAPSSPPAEAAVPVIGLNAITNSGNLTQYQLVGWQTNGNASLVGQWNIFNSDSAGNIVPAGSKPIFVGFNTPGQTYTMNYNLNLGNYYLLQYGNYNECFSWNGTSRLIYMKQE